MAVLLSFAALSACLFADHPPTTFEQTGSGLSLANRELRIEFVQTDRLISLSRFCGVATRQDYAAPSAVLWQLVLRRNRGRDAKEALVDNRAAIRVSSRCEGSAAARTLRLRWEGVAAGGEADALDVEVTVTLKAGDPLSRWRIAVTNHSRTWGLWNVIFPVLELLPVGREPADNFLALGRSRGVVVPDPFRKPNGPAFGMMSSSGGYWPGTFNMQFQALYDNEGTGLYLATHDGGGFKKSFYVLPQPGRQVLQYKIGHYPPNMGWPAENFRLNYDVCIGPFRGDWFDACQLYRAWATRQPWCRRGPMLARRDVPRWYKESPLALYLMNYHGEKQVPELRDRMLDWLRAFRAELPLTWYVWKQHIPEMTDYNKPGSRWKVPDARSYPCGNIHDGNYPRLPALPNFADACRAIATAGGHVQAYVCAQLYDPGLNENAPYAAQAKPHAVRDVKGNIPGEAGNVGWTMCGRTKWWQQRMADTVTELVRREHVGGVYFDTFYGGYVQCFDTRHGHSHGGGDGPYLTDRQLSVAVRGAMKRAAPGAVMTGENPVETAIDLLDGFLYRWTTWPDMAPIFATVYGDYIRRHAIKLDPTSAGFYIQAAALFVEGAQMGWLPIHAAPHFLNDPKYAGQMKFLRQLAACWRPEAGGRYLTYGQLLRPLRFVAPDPMPTVSYQEPDHKHYKDGRITVPALQSGVFKAADGSLGMFIVNIGNQALPARAVLPPEAKGRKVIELNPAGEDRNKHAIINQELQFDLAPQSVRLFVAM